MATPKLKPVDRIAYEPVMIALSEARALAWFLAQLGDEKNRVRDCIADSALDQAADVVPWVQQAIADRLRQAHDEIEIEYRKIDNTTLLARNMPALMAKDGA